MWYYNWWVNDNVNFEKYYEEYQEEVIKDKNIEEIMNLANLWTLAFTRKNRNKDLINDKTETLLKLLEEKEKSQSRVIQLEAKTRICIIKIILEEDIDKQFDNLINIVEDDFVTLARMIENMLSIYNGNEKYDKLYELITDKLTNRKGEIQRAEMYLKKSKMLSTGGKHYDAISILGKCLTLLYKEETNGKLIEAYINIGANFESIGLLYAAKNYYIAAIALFMEIFLRENDLDVFSLKIINRIIDLEIQAGNVESAIEWIHIKNIFFSILIDKSEEFKKEDEEEYLLQRDVLLSSQILRTNFDDFKVLDKIIYDCSNNGLITSEIMAKYVLGEYDNELLEECGGDKAKVDSQIKEFYKASLQQKLSIPVYNNEKEKAICSMLNGNTMKVNYIATNLMNRFGEFILALLENTFATIHSHNTYMRGDIIVNLQEKNSGKFDINYSFDGIDTYTITIDSINMYDISIENHKKITNMLFKLLANIFAVNFIYKDYEKRCDETHCNLQKQARELEKTIK